MATEEERAVIYREEHEAMAAARRAREQALAGDPDAAAALRERWAPLRAWPGWEPPDWPLQDAVEVRR